MRPAAAAGAPSHPGRLRSLLQEALRIDVDLELQVALDLGRGGEPPAQETRKVEGPWRLHQNAKSIASAYDRKRSFSRAEYSHLVGAVRGGGKLACKGFRHKAIAGRNNETREPPERRGAPVAPRRQRAP